MSTTHHRRWGALATAVASVTVFALVSPTAPASADSPKDLGRTSGVVPIPDSLARSVVDNHWLVEIEGTPETRGGSRTANESSMARTERAMRSAAGDITITQRYRSLWNGVAIRATPAEAAAIARADGVVKVYPVTAIRGELPKPDGVRPALATAIEMTGVSTVQRLGHTGKGIKVGIIDSGIDIDHPAFGGSGEPGTTTFPTSRVKWGHDFVGDNYDVSGKHGSPEPKPDNNPDDCGGHGTHVAGIVGGKDNEITGVAPDVEFGAYRVFGCAGGVGNDIVLAAMERAADDGMDVVNMSLGWDFATWPDHPLAKAADALVDRGVITVVANGNAGGAGIFSSGAPAVASKVIAVGSTDNVAVKSDGSFRVSGGDPVAYFKGDGGEVPTAGEGTLVAAGPDVAEVEPTSPVGLCNESMPLKVDVKDRIVLAKRGVCTFHDKALNAQKAGARALVLYNREDLLMVPSVKAPEGGEAITIPVIMITQSAGEQIHEQLAKSETKLAWDTERPTVKSPSGGLMSRFSSYGLTADLGFNPTISAPGGNIWSSWPLEQTPYASISGTSMATPHVAGIVALMLEARPELKGKSTEMVNLMQNTAKQVLFRGRPDLGISESVHLQGAGQIDAVGMLQGRHGIVPSQLALGEGEKGNRTYTLTLTNDSDTERTWKLSKEDAVATKAPNVNAQLALMEAFAQMPESVKVPAKGTATVTVTLGQPQDAPNGLVYGGFLHFTADDDALHVPFVGMAGDYQAEKVLTNFRPGTPDERPLPALGTMIPGADKVEPYYPGEGEVPTYSPAGGHFPVTLFHLDYPVSHFIVDVHKAGADGKAAERLGNALDLGAFGRTGDEEWFSWNGEYLADGATEYSKAPLGADYVFRIRVLKALGDADNPKHWEEWTSTPFTFAESTGPTRVNPPVVSTTVICGKMNDELDIKGIHYVIDSDTGWQRSGKRTLVFVPEEGYTFAGGSDKVTVELTDDNTACQLVSPYVVFQRTQCGADNDELLFMQKGVTYDVASDSGWENNERTVTLKARPKYQYGAGRTTWTHHFTDRHTACRS